MGVENNFETARLWYEKAAAQDHARGQTNLGRMYVLGTGVEVDFTKAFHWYEKAAEQGYARAQTNLGALYEAGQGVAQNYAKAIALYTKAAEQNYARAQFYLGRLFEQGAGVEKDVARASKLYAQAAALGHVNARKQLAKFKSVPSRTNEKTIRKKQAAFDKKNVEAEQIKKNHEHFARAGDPDSQHFIGLLYLNGGDGYEMDAEKGAYWLNLAAAKGNIAAKYQLGLLYLNGEGVEEDSQKGILLLEQAAENGNIDAQCTLAVMYLDGIGVKQDNEYAIFWLQKAVGQDYRIAIDVLNSIIEEQAETTDNYNSKRAAVLYQFFIAEQQRRGNTSQDIRISSNEINENTPDEPQEKAAMNSSVDKNKNDIHARVASLNLEIERLTDRIESGVSDSDYEHYMQLKSPVFVIHDSERLETYQTKLDKLLLEMESQ